LKASLLLGGLLFSTAIFAQDDRLISGPGSTLTENKCKICHELQHIRRQPLSRGEWADNLKNMRERGTPMNDAEQQVILEYLSTYYNRDKPAPAPAPDTLATGGDPMDKLLGEKGCIGCHATDRRIVGPSFKEVAARYSPASAEQLARKVREGGGGAWGNVPMPPNPVSEEEARALVAWVLRLK
jgi:cytochrome c551/c552